MKIVFKEINEHGAVLQIEGADDLAVFKGDALAVSASGDICVLKAAFRGDSEETFLAAELK
jgi:hypothetical protein